MRKKIFSMTKKRFFLTLACMFLLNFGVWAQEKSVAPGINEGFKEDPDRWIEFFHFSSSDPRQQKEILDTIKLKPGMDIADVGAGSGVHALLFAEKVSPGGKVYAVDIIQEFLDHIEAESKEKGVKNVQCVLGSDSSCNLKEASVDVVFTCDTYHHFEYPFKMMASMHKALRPDGQFIIIDFKDKSWHVRADSKTVIEEITGSGFKLADSREILDRFFIARFKVVK
jgi:ubiquinone/menaquinone biosynthesis C-methylase UbiE